ncbi:hypothetical protein KDD93_01195 [Campylobacter sp. faydin G-24]|uniref:Uncharacterized protein n=1 Tax=Campylobacter anatolicus TaxID=2829105 RepID=A0ABS5HGQ2_9BACT|nr:hypothetical protein [Campylobacter anatolicus]MBR8463190.1 hypothetical protein [Campylobacter anatolicus]
MKKFITILVLLSMCSFADTCDNPVMKDKVKEETYVLPLKISDDNTIISVSCVDNNYEITYSSSSKSLRTLTSISDSENKYVLCLYMDPIVKDLVLPSGRATERFLDKNSIERYKVSVTYNECKKLIPDF